MWRKKHHGAMPENPSGAAAVWFRDSVGGYGLSQPTRSTDILHRSLSSPQPVVSASSSVKEVRMGKFNCMVFKTSRVYCLLACHGCTRRQSFPEYLQKLLKTFFFPLSQMEFSFWPKRDFSLKMKMFHSKVFKAENLSVC